MSEKFERGDRVLVDPDATYTCIGVERTFAGKPHDPARVYRTITVRPDGDGDWRITDEDGDMYYAAERYLTPYKDTPRESIDDTGNPAPWPVDVEGPEDVLSALAATLTEGLRDAIPHSPGCGRWARPGVGATPRGPHGRVGAPAGPPEVGCTVTGADGLARAREKSSTRRERTTMSEIKYGQRVNIDPDATYTDLDGCTTPTFRDTPYDPKVTYVVAYGPDRHGDLEIVQWVGGRSCVWLWAEERFVTPYVEHDAGEETPPGGGVSRETALAALGRAWCTPIEEQLPSQSDILTGAAPADVVSTLAALAEANIRLVRILKRSADR